MGVIVLLAGAAALCPAPDANAQTLAPQPRIGVPARGAHAAKPPTPPAPAPLSLAPQFAQNFEQDRSVVTAELQSLIEQALTINPRLIAEREQARASAARIGPAGLPADPVVGFNLKDMPTTFDFTRENATEKQIIAQATYPFPGKLTLRRAVAAKEAAAASERTHAQTLALITAVRSAFDDVFLADKDIQLALEQRARLKEFVDIATSKYRVGPGLQQDVLNADVAVARVDSQLIVLARQRLSREIALATLLDQSSLKVPALGVLPELELGRSELELEQTAQVTSPAIREAERTAERDEKAYELANKLVLPDFAVQVIYGSRNDFTHPETGKPDTVRPDLLSGELLMTVPVFYYWKQREEVKEAAANLARSRARLEAARRQVLNSVHDLYARLLQHQAVAASLHDEVIPLARAAVAASISAYQVDQVDFLTLLAAEDKLDGYRADYWHEQGEAFRTIAELQELAGTPLLRGGWQ